MKKKRGTSVAVDDKWQAESDLRSLCEAAEISKDPKRLAAAQAVAKEKLLELGKVMSA